MSITTLERYNESLKALSRYEKAYHDEDKEVVPDAVYDALRRTVKELADELNLNYQPAVGGRSGKVPHRTPMLSLKDVFNKEELVKWLEGVRKKLNEPFQVTVEYKSDGLALSLIYVNRQLVRALTRGDGVSGDDVTARFLTLCPTWKVSDAVINGEIRGEGIVTTAAFSLRNEQLVGSNEQPYSTQRHLAAAMLRGSGGFTEGFHFIPYATLSDDAIIVDGAKLTTAEMLLKLENSNSYTCSNPLLLGIFNCDDVFSNRLVDFLSQTERSRQEYPHLVDGLVFKVNSDHHKTLLGYNTSYPKWAVAYKFPPEGAWSTLRDVYFQVGKRGTCTPVAVIDPVKVGGVEITNPTLHNWGEILRLKLNIGSKVYLERRGDVIPKITYAENDSSLAIVEGVTNIPYPEHCPCCDTLTVVEGAYVMCNNPFCQEKVMAQLLDATGKHGLDIRGLGDVTIKNLIESGHLRTVADIFTLTVEVLAEEGELGEVRAEKIMEYIDYARTNTPLHRLIYAVGFSGVGIVGAKKLADLIAGDVSSYTDHITADKRGCGIFSELLNEVSPLIPLTTGLPLIPVCVTGSFDVPRDEIEVELASRGYKVTSTVSKNTRYLFAGKNPTQKKIDAATAKGVEVVQNGIATLDEIKAYLRYEDTKIAK